jgi:hypothetical protein
VDEIEKESEMAVVAAVWALGKVERTVLEEIVVVAAAKEGLMDGCFALVVEWVVDLELLKAWSY